MKVLAVAAHPDDIEIFMYGTLSACKKRGDEIFLVVATDGAAGGLVPGEKLAKKRKEESICGLKHLGVPFSLNFPDGRLSMFPKVTDKIVKLINKIKPDFIITHDPEDYHHDHRSLSKYVTNASSFTCPVFFCDTLMGLNFIPEYYVDITNFFEEKKKSILEHKSQCPKKLINLAYLMNAFRSGQCNRSLGTYAEAFRQNSNFPFADTRNYLPMSPALQPFFKSCPNSLV